MVEFKYTQAIIVRKDIEIPKGKLAVQVAHAALGAFLDQDDHKLKYEWLEEGQRKLVLKVNNLNDLYDIKEFALDKEIPAYLVEDFACTVFDEPTVTCIGLGPVSIEKMNEITKGLKLY